MDSFLVARTAAYAPGWPADAKAAAPIPLTAAHESEAVAAAAIQPQKAGVRLAKMLDDALGQAVPANIARTASAP